MFQFTHPGRGATVDSDSFTLGAQVSIHAPREGCDSLSERILVAFGGFQFTHPGRGATLPIRVHVGCINVSIHAPREGCDLFMDAHLKVQDKFQFTHPVRGATALSLSIRLRS